MYDAILLPTDGSEAAEAAIEQAIGQASAFGATLHGVFVVELAVKTPLQITLDQVIEQIEADGEEYISRIAAAAEAAGVEAVTSVEHGMADEAIVNYVDAHDIDLVVMGTHGRRGVERQLLGSVTERVIRTCPVPVLAVRQG